MIDLIKYSIRVSRFRFWIYTAGTYVVGYSLGAVSFSYFFSLDYILYLIYFFFPANLFIYGVNDYWDEKTDEKNPKKGTKEEKLTKENKKKLLKLLYLVSFFSIFLLLFQDNISRIIFLIFISLSYFYSAKPLRFKSLPVLDFSSNMLYVMPGIFGFYLASGELPGLFLLVAGYSHISAMHIFSAVPDIKYDKKAKIKTTASILGKRNSLILCFLFWAVLSFIAIYYSGFHPFSFLVLIYPTIPLILILNNNLSINKIYWILPYINTFMGGLLTFMLLLRMFLII